MSADYSAMSDAQLDAAYKALRDANNSAEYTKAALEIGTRLEGVSSFLSGIAGITRFPLYQSYKGNFNQVDAAQSAIADSAGNVAHQIGTIGNSVYLLALIAAIAFLLHEVKR